MFFLRGGHFQQFAELLGCKGQQRFRVGRPMPIFKLTPRLRRCLEQSQPVACHRRTFHAQGGLERLGGSMSARDHTHPRQAQNPIRQATLGRLGGQRADFIQGEGGEVALKQVPGSPVG